MSAKIFSPNTPAPIFNLKTWKQDDIEYIESCKKECDNGPYSGEIIRIPIADGYAQYMVISLSPLQLFHLELGDAYDSEFAELLTKGKVVKMIEGKKTLEKLFK